MPKSAEFFINLRKFHRVSRVQISRLLDIPYHTWAAWERGEREPPQWVPPMLEMYAAFVIGNTPKKR